MTEPVTVVGGGLAGCEAAWQLARRGIAVRLREMKPRRYSAAHQSRDLAELVCSNSLRSDRLHNAVGLLHAEMRALDSLILQAADATRVPAGGALAVDRAAFSRHVTDALESLPGVERVMGEVTRIPGGTVILATGPLTSDALATEIRSLCGEALYFYDSISPIVYRDSLDASRIFCASRYEDGEGDYWNLPLDRDAYDAFVRSLVRAETLPLHACEEPRYFEGCLPIEVMAERGLETLRFGPMKPVGLVDPRTGRVPHAVVQLRREDREGVLLNLVGFQTRMRIGAQKSVFRSLPGLERAVFARFGSMHRNTFICAPEWLDATMQHRAREGLYFAGQIAGVEGYVESAALGLWVGVAVAHAVRDLALDPPPATSALGSLIRWLTQARPRGFQPMNVNFGLLPRLDGGRGRASRRERNQRLGVRALADLGSWAQAVAP
ncbi:MAG: methylenetetrahydrofolate--tRNA-(uracil(54)-C(5))-methyltransferase (FADH(2)-oxidizing) TrmFO [Myxococcota bacterium]